MKDLSLIMPVFNPPEDRLRVMLASVSRQPGVDFELIAVNDGSTDGTGAVLREWQAAHPGLMKIVDRAHAGLGLSRNAGFAVSEGRYVWFVDGDDEIRPGCLEKLVETMDGIGTGQLLMKVDVAPPGTDAPFPPCSGAVVREVSKSFAFANFFRAVWKWVLRRDFLLRVGVSFSDAGVHEDLPESAKWIAESDRLFYSEEVWYRYCYRPGSLAHSVLDYDSLASALQIDGLFRSLAERHPDCRDWLLFHSQYGAAEDMQRCSEALERLSRAGNPPAGEVARFEALRESFRRIAEGVPEERALFAVYDRGHRNAIDETRREADALRKRAESAEKRLADMRSSLSWRVTAPLRAVAGLFAVADKGRKPS